MTAPRPSPTPVVDDGTGPATVALAVVTTVVALSMGRLFSNGGFLLPILSAVIAGHGMAWLGRKRGWSLPLSLVISTLSGWVLIVYAMVPGSLTYGLPLGKSVHAVSTALSSAYRDFGQAVAPTPPARGFVIAAMVGVLTTAVLADWSAFRIRSLFEAVIPSFTVFLFVALLGTPRNRALATGAYICAVLLFLFVQQAALATDAASWFASRSARGVAGLARGGAALAAVTVIGGLVIGPNLPGAHDQPLLPYRNRGTGANRVRQEATPLADIRGRLVNQSGVEVFTVKASRPTYWRLTSLDTFDGTIWRQDFSYDSVRHRLPGGLPNQLQTYELSQDFTIEALSTIWLPVAYRPTRIDGTDAMFDNDSGSLITKSETADGTSYQVISELAHLTPGDLSAPAATAASGPDPRYLALPPISPRVVNLAHQVVAGATSPYQEALALENFFQKNFKYDLNVRIPSDESGHDERVLEQFLFNLRRGYCEQFAGAYAVMARAVGLPTRVAVGFTPGELQSDGLYHVRGLNAHAWPEVWIPGAGWTYFEPTPGRGAPDTAQYTGVPEAQASPAGAGRSTVSSSIPITTIPQETSLPAQTPLKEKDTAGKTGRPKPNPPLWHNRLLRVAGGLAIAVFVWVTGVPLLSLLRRRRRRHRATTAQDRVLVDWMEVSEALDRHRLARRPSETPAEYAARVPAGIVMGEQAAGALRSLADDTAVASYAAGPVSDDVAERSHTSLAVVLKALHDVTPLPARIRQAVDVRPLLPHRVRHRVTARSAERRAA